MNLSSASEELKGDDSLGKRVSEGDAGVSLFPIEAPIKGGGLHLFTPESVLHPVAPGAAEAGPRVAGRLRELVKP